MIGIGGSLVEWFKFYLAKGPQIVVVNEFDSNMFLPESGVPRGSHLGLLLLLIFVMMLNVSTSLLMI